MREKLRYILVRDLEKRGTKRKNRYNSIGIETVKLQTKDIMELVLYLNNISSSVRVMILYTNGGWIDDYNPVEWCHNEKEFVDKTVKFINAKKQSVMNKKERDCLCA